MSVFQDLYDSEINFQISTMWDGGFEVKLGDEMNGYKAETTFHRFGLIERWLIEKASEHYPNSLFARVYCDGVNLRPAEGIYHAGNPYPSESFSREWSYPPDCLPAKRTL